MNKRGISRRVLAQHQVDTQMRDAACKTERKLWSRAESRYAEARTAEQAEDAAAPALVLCAGCGVFFACLEWAARDKHTGLAAGRAWVDGVSKDPAQLRAARG